MRGYEKNTSIALIELKKITIFVIDNKSTALRLLGHDI